MSDYFSEKLVILCYPPYLNCPFTLSKSLDHEADPAGANIFQEFVPISSSSKGQDLTPSTYRQRQPQNTTESTSLVLTAKAQKSMSKSNKSNKQRTTSTSSTTSTAPARSITVTYPPQDYTSLERMITIEGYVTPYAPGTISALGSVGPILPTGLFRVEGVFLPDGPSNINVVATSNKGSVMARKTLRVTYTVPSEASSLITISNGGASAVTDQASDIFGAKIQVPPGMAKREFASHIVYDPEHTPVVPFGYMAIGPPVLFLPETEAFNGLVTLSIPVNLSLLPPQADPSTVQVLHLASSGWEFQAANHVTGSSGTDLMSFGVSSLGAGPFIAVVQVPLASGQVLIETNPESATIYIDGADSGLITPAVIDDLALGEHEAKIFLRGYNELFLPFDSSLPEQTRIKKDLNLPLDHVPVVEIAGNLDGYTTTATFLEITASVSLDGAPIDDGVGVVSINGLDAMQRIVGGTIKGFVSLENGYNYVEVRANGPNGSTGVSSPAIINRETAVRRGLLRHESSASSRQLVLSEIRAILEWDTLGTDIDLHVFDPLGNHAFYQAKKAIPNAQIDVDDTNGYGPEIFTFPNPTPGTFKVTVDSYNIDGLKTTASLRIFVGGTQVFSGSYTFTTDDRNDTGGKPDGADLNAFWNAYTFDVGSLVITNVKSTAGPSSIFTTASGENQIFITTQAPPSVLDASILYDIEEVGAGLKVISPSTVGRSTSFIAKHSPVTNFKSPSKPLNFKIVAYTLKDGVRDLTSAPVFVTQDVKSQIRQEYVDKRDLSSTFNVIEPPRNQIIGASEFTQESPYFTFDELAKWSDYYSAGYSVIGHSVGIANTLRLAWGHPLSCTSAWRNPRRNDRVGGVMNSYHQLGNAVDIVPIQNKWPGNVAGCNIISDFQSASKALACLARKIFPNPAYDVVSELDHLHIEKQVSGDATYNDGKGGEISSVLRLEIGAMTILGEGIKLSVYWPGTAASGVTLGIGYDLGSRSKNSIVSDLVAAGMAAGQANIIAEASNLRGEAAKKWVQDNSSRVGSIQEAVVRRLFATQFPNYTLQAKALALSVNPLAGTTINARSRELIAVPPKPLYTYVMKEEQWGRLHPAMLEFITDLKLHGGFYGYDRIAQINTFLIAHDGDPLQQFKKVATLFGSPPPASGSSYMDTYARAVGLVGVNTETFYGIPPGDISGAKERRNRIRLSFLLKVINALSAGSVVEMVAPGTSTQDTSGCKTLNPHGAETCAPGPQGCMTKRAEFVKGAITKCFPATQQTPTTYLGHSGEGNSLDAWPIGGGWKVKATGQLKTNMDALALWLMKNHNDLKLKYMIFYNRIWNPSRDAFGAWWDCARPEPNTNPPQYRCACMGAGSCADVTQGHYDHLHLTVLY